MGRLPDVIRLRDLVEMDGIPDDLRPLIERAEARLTVEPGLRRLDDNTVEMRIGITENEAWRDVAAIARSRAEAADATG